MATLGGVCQHSPRAPFLVPGFGPGDHGRAFRWPRQIAYDRSHNARGIPEMRPPKLKWQKTGLALVAVADAVAAVADELALQRLGELAALVIPSARPKLADLVVTMRSRIS